MELDVVRGRFGDNGYPTASTLSWTVSRAADRCEGSLSTILLHPGTPWVALAVEVIVLGDHFLRGDAPVDMPLPAVGLGGSDGAVAVVDIDPEASRGR